MHLPDRRVPTLVSDDIAAVSGWSVQYSFIDDQVVKVATGSIQPLFASFVNIIKS